MANQNPQHDIDASVLNINLTVQLSAVKAFFLLLQNGFSIKCLTGISIEQLLYNQLGLTPQLVEKKISTVFLDGKPVDDIAMAIVQDGSSLALSGAMPGLVGATLRRKSPLASFRQSISVESGLGKSEPIQGHVMVKLFNVLLKELGPFFLRTGIFVSAPAFVDLVSGKADDFLDKCIQVVVNGVPVTLQSQGEWHSLLASHNSVHLKVKVG